MPVGRNLSTGSNIGGPYDAFEAIYANEVYCNKIHVRQDGVISYTGDQYPIHMVSKTG